MEELRYEFSADRPLAQPAHVGVVASADLEILATPRTDNRATVVVTTSVDGFGAVWHDVLDAFFAQAPLAGDFAINDAGATPGTVTLRLAQLKEIAA